MKNRLIAVAITSMFLSNAVLADNKVFIGGWSHHFNAKGSPNEVHNNIGVSYKSWDVMYFKNSYSKPSVMVAKNFEIYKGLGVKVGLSSGYSKATFNVGGVVPVAQLTYDLTFGPVGVQVGYVPYSGVRSNGLISLSTFVKF